MTAARQERKSRRLLAMAATLIGLTILAGAGLRPERLVAATTDQVVANRHTGLAIDGFDPVGYFANGEPKLGRPGLEFRHAAVTWRFVNQGNRAAFIADPDVYMPRFGGHDPIAIARGVATAGHPMLWRIAHQRLYLFYSAEARSAFGASPDAAIEAAERHWSEVRLTLTP
jgi:hypothetical protein